MALQAMDVISNHCLEAGRIKGGCKNLPRGRRVCVGKSNLFSGFLFHSVKERGYTRGKEVKGHCSWESRNSLPFFIGTDIKANRVILTHSSFSCPVDYRQTSGVVSPASLSNDHPGSYGQRNCFSIPGPGFLMTPLNQSPLCRSCGKSSTTRRERVFTSGKLASVLERKESVEVNFYCIPKSLGNLVFFLNILL